MPASGTLNCHRVTPRKYRMLAASTCPAILAGADISRTSSISPTPKMAAPARTTPSGSDEPWKMSWRAGMQAATTMAARNPRNMAAPPP